MLQYTACTYWRRKAVSRNNGNAEASLCTAALQKQ